MPRSASLAEQLKCLLAPSCFNSAVESKAVESRGGRGSERFVVLEAEISVSTAWKLGRQRLIWSSKSAALSNFRFVQGEEGDGVVVENGDSGREVVGALPV